MPDAAEIADRAALFKLSSKQLGATHGIVPSFMAKPHAGLPGTSGHVHISLVDPKTGQNLFARDEEDGNAEWPDIRNLSDVGRHLLNIETYLLTL
jgi:glutamine synthetase